MAMSNTVNPQAVADFMAKRAAAKGSQVVKPDAWVKVDMTQLDETVNDLVATLLSAEATAKAARAALAQCLAEDYVAVPPGMVLRASVKWGQLSYLIATPDAPKSRQDSVTLVRKA